MINAINNILDFQVDSIKKLNGYDNINYLIQSKNKSYILKTYPYSKALERQLKAEIEILLILQKEPNKKFPKPIQISDDKYVIVKDLAGQKTICRMLSYLEGNFLGDVTTTNKLLTSFGHFLASIDLALKDVMNDTIKAKVLNWDIQHFELNKDFIQDVENVHDRKIVKYFFQQFEENAKPLFPTLRNQIIHNDANDWNTLSEGEEVTGIIDFGDLVYTPLINELAIAIMYICYDKEEPLKWIPPFLKSYNELIPLQAKELEILYYLIAARLCTSLVNAAHARVTNPSNTYAASSEKNALKMLHKWIRINPIHAENLFKNSVGLGINPIVPTSETIQQRLKFISPILSLSYEQPIHMSRSAFQYMYDKSGCTYLDAYNNIPHVGHSHPIVVEAGQKQMARLNTNTRYIFDQLAEYAEMLLQKFPTPLSKVYFVNSGSAASDLAIRMAKAHTQASSVMVLEHGYHGNTQTGIQISDYKFNNPKGEGQHNQIIKADIPDVFRGKYKDRNAGYKYAQDAIFKLKDKAPIAAFIAEPIVGCGGQIPLAGGYLKHLYSELKAKGTVCISDEVQTGFGRLGQYFWGFEAHHVIPDMVVLGKPMGNGHPIGAVVTTEAISNSFSQGVEFFSSFGGNPVSCAIGMAVLKTIEEESLQKNALEVGTYYMSQLNELKAKYSCIGDVRGSGLFIGVDIVKPDSLQPDRTLANHIKNELKNQFVLISTDGPSDNVLKSKPPLCFTKDDVNEVISKIDEILKR